ncbi:ubiquitinyl hydrolase 1 [Malassezia cuniculi]|uniref:Ubiquitin carboxyl-terminal hydrolase n=1 Tax=Malassezia cuniculi TaxID=948313 RepID=A0AAF0ESZ5_9BASI|nr:ubiquitinyl hydrolase 1 [Malassezia cuniculi]
MSRSVRQGEAADAPGTPGAPAAPQHVTLDRNYSPRHPVNLRRQVRPRLDTSFSLKSYVGAAATLFEKAQKFDRQGSLDSAFVNYLMAASVASFVPKHPEWEQVKQQRGATFASYQELMKRTPEIVSRTKAIEAQLCEREEALADQQPPPLGPKSPRRLPELPHDQTLSVEQLWQQLNPGFDKTSDGVNEWLVRRAGCSVLLVDSRPRAAFALGTIGGADVLCLDAELVHDNASEEDLAELLDVAPLEHERFANRASYDLVIIFDTESRGVTGNVERVFSALRRSGVSPTLLRGGFDAWKRVVGDNGVSRPQEETPKPASLAPVQPEPSPVEPQPKESYPPTKPCVPPPVYYPSSSGSRRMRDIPSSLHPGQPPEYPAAQGRDTTLAYGQSAVQVPPPAAPSAYDRMPPRPPAERAPMAPKDTAKDQIVLACGLHNFGNSCYMNATLQCLSATVSLSRYMLDGMYKRAINVQNPLGTRGALAEAYAQLVRRLWRGQGPFAPYEFRDVISRVAPVFRGSEQQDAQEFLVFLLDGLHEDLNLVLQRPAPFELSDAQQKIIDTSAPQVASSIEWQRYRTRENSVIVDTFQGQLRNRMTCTVCGTISTTYNTFMYLSLPIPHVRRGSVSLEQCLNAFVHDEVMDGANAWHCPKCKKPRRSIKQLTFARLPPILLIQLKRFYYKGAVTEKIRTRVTFPIDDFDLTNYMPPPLPPGAAMPGYVPSQTQRPPYVYDLYGVTHHFGDLNTGHYTASVRTHGRWMECDDTRIGSESESKLHSDSLYILWFRRQPLPVYN